MSSCLAIITARKGSKGVPGKNMRMLAGKPLVAYSFEAALGVPDLDILVSSDDPEILSIARKYGIDTEYERPAHVSTDLSSSRDTLMHALDWYRNRHSLPQYLTVLQPTSPFRTSADIQKSLDMLAASRAPSVVGISSLWSHPHDCVVLDSKGWQKLIPTENNWARRQDSEDQIFFINGALYTVRTQHLITTGEVLSPQTKMFVMDDLNTCDIDTMRDFIVAEALMLARQQGIL